MFSPLYPIDLKLKDLQVAVVGGGEVACRKVNSLLECGASVTVISPELTDDLHQAYESGAITWQPRKYRKGDLVSSRLVVCATDDSDTNLTVFREAQEQGALVNVVDKPELCDFFVPSVVRRGGLTLTVSTAGMSPALSKRIRQQLETLFGPEYAVYVEMLHEARKLVRDKFPDNVTLRAKAVEHILDLPLLNLITSGQPETARERITECISRLSD